MIDSYSFGRVTVGGSDYRSDLIIYPERVESGWWRRQGHHLCLEDLREVLAYGPRVLIVGQGKPGRLRVDQEVIDEARSRNIELFAAPTEQAVREYNRRSGEDKVVAALHLTC